MTAREFEPRDNQIYDELWDVAPASVVTQGEGVIVQDVFGFYYFTSLAANDEVTFIYRMRQVLAAKKTGSGEAILAGDKLYFYPGTNDVSPTPTGVAGTDYYFCGWAKKDASANAETVLMNFDGTRYDEDI